MVEVFLQCHFLFQLALGKHADKYGQPNAANMREMTWNDDLTSVAQRWAKQCNYTHDHNTQRYFQFSPDA